MQQPLACEVQHLERFISEQESLAFQKWMNEHYDLTDFEEIHFATEQTHLIQPWKMMFVDSRLTDFNILPREHGRRAPLSTFVRENKKQSQSTYRLAIRRLRLFVLPKWQRIYGFPLRSSSLWPY